MKHLFVPSLVLLLCGACNKEAFFDGPNFYQDDFEAYVSLIDLLPQSELLWSFNQLTKAGNSITLDSTKAHGGRKSLRFAAEKSANGSVSKSSIAKQNMAFWEGETVRMSAWYFIEGTDSLKWLFLMDLEEQTAIGAGPGMRLAMVDNQLRVEYKFFEKDIVQVPGQAKELPRNQWVELIWEIKLSRKNAGTVKLWQNGQLIIDAQNKTTLPKDVLYFQQGTKGMYSSFEIGITANSAENDLLLWLDDVRIEKVN